MKLIDWLRFEAEEENEEEEDENEDEDLRVLFTIMKNYEKKLSEALIEEISFCKNML